MSILIILIQQEYFFIYNELTFFLDIFRVFWEFLEIKFIKKNEFFKM